MTHFVEHVNGAIVEQLGLRSPSSQQSFLRQRNKKNNLRLKYLHVSWVLNSRAQNWPDGDFVTAHFVNKFSLVIGKKKTFRVKRFI